MKRKNKVFMIAGMMVLALSACDSQTVEEIDPVGGVVHIGIEAKEDIGNIESMVNSQMESVDSKLNEN